MLSTRDYRQVGAELRAVGGDLRAVGAAVEEQMRRGRSAAEAIEEIMGGLPSPAFGASGRNVERRAPAGFVEDATGNLFWTLAAAIGAQSQMVCKVSRVCHVDRLLIVPDAPGAIITSITVGDEEQLLRRGCPVELFGESALTDVLPDNFSPLGSGLDLTVVIENTTAAAISGTIGIKGLVKR